MASPTVLDDFLRIQPQPDLRPPRAMHQVRLNRTWQSARLLSHGSDQPTGARFVPRALPVRDIPARSLAVAMASQPRSHRSGSCKLIFAPLSLQGGASTAAAALTIGALKTTPVSVDSALPRAHKTARDRLPEQGQQAALRSAGPELPGLPR